MITLKLLGGVKFATGKTSIIIDKQQSTLNEIIKEIQNDSKNTKILNEQNLIITVNGVDSSVSGGKDTIIKSGDVVTIVTIIHGG